MTIRARVLLIMAIVSLASAGVASLLGHRIAGRAIEQQSFDKLVAVREMKANQVEDYIQQIVDQTLTLAESPMVIDAMRALRNGFVSIADDVDPSSAEAEKRVGAIGLASLLLVIPILLAPARRRPPAAATPSRSPPRTRFASFAPSSLTPPHHCVVSHPACRRVAGLLP